MLKVLVVALLGVTLSGCDEPKKNSQGQTTDYPNRDICVEGLTVKKMGHSKYANGFMYKRTKDDKLIPCEMN